MLKYLFVILSLSLTLMSCTKKSEVVENSITFPLRVNLKSLDPATGGDEGSDEVTGSIYEGLMEYSYLKRPLQVQPDLAEGLPSVSKDGLTQTFKIKSGVKFQDSEAFPDGKGREMVAQDFIYSWKRLANPKMQSEGWWIFDGKVKGLNEWREKMSKGSATYDTPVEGLEAPDAHTLVVHLTRPYFQLLYVLSMPYAAVVPHEAVEKYGAEFLNHPVGTGPYRFESWIRGSKAVLTKNPTWHGGTYPSEEGEAGDRAKGLLADAGKALPFVDKLVFLELPEDQPRWLNFMKGTTDITEIPKDNFDGAVEGTKLRQPLLDKGMWLQIYMAPDVVYFGFNMADPILGKNVNLRRALSLAFDTRIEMEKFYNNRVIMAHSPVTPGVDIFDPNFKNPWKEYNVEKAKEYMKKAGFPDGKGLAPLEYNVAGSSTDRQMSEYLTNEWSKIGVKVNIIQNSWPQFQDRLRKKKAQIFGIAWIADYPDSENLFQLLYSKNVSPGSNAANFENKDFDKAYDEAAILPPGPKRAELYRKMRDIFVDQMPWIPTVHRLGYVLSQGWVSNVKRHKTMHTMFKYLRVDMAKKKELKPKL